MAENWTADELDEGKKWMIRNEDHRCIAIVSFLPDSEVFQGDVLKLFVNSNRMFTACKRVLAWHDYGTMNIQTALAGLGELVEDIEG